jgi:hypothetical protein
MQFAYLQTLDLLSTAAFLLQGVQEGNPFVRLAIQVSPNPVVGLALVKVAGIAMAVTALRLGKEQFLTRINVFFAILVAWNLVCLVLASK